MALPILDGNQSATTLSTILAGGEHTPAHTVVSLGSTAISNITSAVSGSVVSISNFPASQTIAGTVTANAVGFDSFNGIARSIPVALCIDGIGQNDPAVSVIIASESGSVNTLNPLPISGTVTANPTGTQTIAGTVTANGGDFAKIPAIETSPPAKAIRIGFGTDENWNGVGLGGSGAPLPVAIFDAAGASDGIGFTQIGGKDYANVNVGNSVTIGSVPNGSLTTRFGTPTTASVAFETTAVTNANRKYLLIQNVTTGSNVITVGIGFTPTTTQGIQLTAGAGITFESSYIPTGAVRILSSVTASNFTILEA